MPDRLFPDDWLLIVDESHVTCSQLQAMYNGDQARKKVLIDHGFRLPSAADNRPLKGEEFWDKAKQTVFVSATPGNWEMEVSGGEVAEQVIPHRGARSGGGGAAHRGAGRRSARRDPRSGCQEPAGAGNHPHQADGGRPHRLPGENEVRVRYLHSEIHSIERIEIIQDLRLGEYDVLVGVNLLREGLDLPEVSLVAILDADRRLPAGRALPDPDHRQGRPPCGGVALLYADTMTDSMAKAISETERRRAIQQAYNEKHGVVPTAAGKKASNSILSFLELSRKLKQDGSDADLVRW